MVTALTKSVVGIDEQPALAANASVFFPIIEALIALRGVNLLTAVTIVAVGDLRRFTSAPQLMAYLGLVPSEHSSGASKSGAASPRPETVMCAASWSRLRGPIAILRKTAVLQRRAERTTQAVQEIAWDAQKRLCGRYQHMEAKGKLKVQACTPVARELAGFI
ncbi:transposase [Massilia sp. HP4]|uniref:transposase n=1 Tax=Massilia sp. HP4 TaxID=2562316 RepID=UPI0010C02E13|nr:transposase [Massilia sp. HP4]